MFFLIDDSKPLVTACVEKKKEKENDPRFSQSFRKLLQNTVNNETFRYKEM